MSAMRRSWRLTLLAALPFVGSSVGCDRAAPAAPPPAVDASTNAKPEAEPKAVAPSPKVEVAAEGELWARLSKAELAPTRIDTPADIFSYLRLSPDGSRIHAYRYRQTIDYSLLSDLVEIDAAKGGAPRVLANTGTDDYVLEYVQDTLYASRAVVDYETCEALRFDLSGPTKLIEAPSELGVVQWFVPTAEGMLFERDDTLFALAPGGRPVMLMEQAPKELGSIVSLGKGRAIVERPSSSRENDEDSALFVITWAAGFRSPTSKEVFRRDAERVIDVVVPWTDREVIVVETHDSNGDNKTDNADTVRALSLDDGTLRTITGGALNVRMVHAHPGGLLLYVHEQLAGQADAAGPLSHLRVRELEHGAEHEIGSVQGELSGWSVSADWSRVIYAEVLDTNHDGDHYNWEDQSRLYLSQL